jgi:hypothetical protein
MELEKEYNQICLKNKLQTNLKYYLLGSNNNYNLLYRFINLLKNKYNNDSIIINQLEELNQHIYNYSFSKEKLIVEDWIFNWNNEILLNDLNNFADTSRNYKIEEQIKELQKEINILKEITLQQNPYIVKIDENTNK